MNDVKQERKKKALKVRKCKNCLCEFETYATEKYCDAICRIEYKERRDADVDL